MAYVVTLKVDNRNGSTYCMVDDYFLIGVFDTEEKAHEAGKKACEGKKATYEVVCVEENVNYFNSVAIGYSHYYE